MMVRGFGAWRALIGVAWLVAAAVPAWSHAAPAQAALKVERVVMLMRHGVRPPTKAQPMAVGFAKDAWPSWDVAPGYLTAHGAQGVARMGAYQRMALAEEGLFAAKGCPAAKDVTVFADSDQRTIKTAEAFAAAFAPGCDIAIRHKPQDVADPMFSPLDEKVGHPIPAQTAQAAVLERLGPGGLEARTAQAKPLLERLQKIYGCCAPPICDKYRVAAPCTLADLPTTLVAGGEKPSMDGALDLASTAAQILLLEYTDGKPMDQVGWGRASKADIEAVLAFHPLEYDIVARPAYVAQRGAAPFLDAISTAFGEGGAKLTLLVGHDTNIAHVGGALDLHWKAGDYPANDPPPGGALGFELLRDAKGQRFVRAFFTAQSMDQLRDLDALDLKRRPFRQVVAIPGCGSPASSSLCPLADFQRLIAFKRPAA
jgi:4-phytase/acid phosphatase